MIVRIISCGRIFKFGFLKFYFIILDNLMGKEDKTIPKLYFDIHDLSVKNVIVYMGRAEVKRSIKLDKISGKTQILLKNISPVIEKQSICVEGKTGAIILEVLYDENLVHTTSTKNVSFKGF